MSKAVDDAAIDDLKPVIPDDDDKPADIPEGFSADEWNDLSDEEKEGIQSSEDDDGAKVGDEDGIDPAILEKIAGEGDDQGGKEPDGQTTTDDPKPDDDGKGDVAKPSLDDFEVADDTLPPKLPDIPLKVSSEVPADLKQKMDDLAEKFEAGDISVREYTDQRDALNREAWAKNLEAAQQAQAKERWGAEQDFFLKRNPAYLEDSLRGKALLGMLDAAVRSLASDEANQYKTGYEILQMAHREIVGIVGQTGGKADGGAEDKREGKGAKPKASLPGIKTLGDVPSSAANATEDPYASIDRLEGEAYEEALEKMTEAQAKAYRARA